MENVIYLPVTAWTAALSATLFLALTWGVITRRRRLGIVLGDGDDRATTKCIRGHANAAEQIPITLIVLALAELGRAPQVGLIAASALFLIGRCMHGAYFSFRGQPWRLRFYGMLATIISQIALIALLLATLVT